MTELGFLAFIGIAAGFIALPGPNVMIVISTSLGEGFTPACRTIAGVAVAMALQLAIAGLGTAWLVSALSRGFEWLKWGGVAYLAILGVQSLIVATGQAGPAQVRRADWSFGKGFLVSITNPKTIIFFAAFLPQFADPGRSFTAQITLLSITFWVLALGINLAYALLASRLAALFQSRRADRGRHIMSGIFYLGGAVMLSMARRT